MIQHQHLQQYQSDKPCLLYTSGRERQKNFLAYCQRMIRENCIYNFHQRDLVYMNPEEQNFSTRFAPFVNERNVMGIMDELR